MIFQRLACLNRNAWLKATLAHMEEPVSTLRAANSLKTVGAMRVAAGIMVKYGLAA